MKTTLQSVLRKVANPPAPQNWVRLIVPNDEVATASRIANLALGVPAFNYVPAAKMCHDRVKLQLDLETALKAIAKAGAPAGRDQNAAFVKAFFSYDEVRRYSEARYVDSYQGFFPISRDVKIPTKPAFTVLENRLQVPVVLCGWKSVPLDNTQRRIVATVYESGLFSYGAYRHAPGEIAFFPEFETPDGSLRMPEIWRRGDHDLLSAGELRDLLEFFAVAQEQAIPIIAEKLQQRVIREREKECEQEQVDRDSGIFEAPTLRAQGELFDGE